MFICFCFFVIVVDDDVVIDVVMFDVGDYCLDDC